MRSLAGGTCGFFCDGRKKERNLKKKKEKGKRFLAET